MGRKKEHELKDYTEEEIAKILENADASKLDPEEYEVILELYALETINLKTGSKEFTAKNRNLVSHYITDFIGKAQDEEEIEIARKYLKMAQDYLSLSQLILTIDKEQGITVGDYDRNIWRATYVLKSIQMAELQKAQGLPVDDDIYLLGNQTKNTLKGFEETINRVVSNYRKTQAVGNLMFFFADYTGLLDFQHLALRFALDLELREILADEAERIEELILSKHKATAIKKYAEQETTPKLKEQAEKDAEELVKKYKPLLLIPNLEKIKVPEEAYDKVHDKYINLSLEEIVKRYKDIEMDFYEEVLSEEFKGAGVNDE